MSVCLSVRLFVCLSVTCNTYYWWQQGLNGRFNVVGLDQCGYSTLDPVSARLGAHLWTGKPPWRRTRHPGLLTLSGWTHPLWAGWNEYPAKAAEVNRHIAWYTSPYPWSCRVVLVPGWELACGDQRWHTGSSSALEMCSWRCAIQICVYVTLIYLLCRPFRLHWLTCLWERLLRKRLQLWPCNFQKRLVMVLASLAAPCNVLLVLASCLCILSQIGSKPTSLGQNMYLRRCTCAWVVFVVWQHPAMC